jgi:anthranilate/para-aminobenzoate synthase component I
VGARGDPGGRLERRALEVGIGPERAFEAFRGPGDPMVLFDGRGGHDGSWPCRLAIGPTMCACAAGPGEANSALDSLSATIQRRRAAGGPGTTGIVIAMAYEALASPEEAREAGWSLVALAVDAAVTFPEAGHPVAVGPGPVLDVAAARLDGPPVGPLAGPAASAASAPLRTSLPREAYLRSVRDVKDHIERGDIYQANLTQRFSAGFGGDAWELYRSLAAATPAPRSAFFSAGGLSIASVSPEIFVDVDASGRAETRPIKGTRPRGRTPAEDAAALEELAVSTKDRAELVMIVDLERNDLGRVARVGSVRVPELCTARSYAAVHHLVARVEAQLRAEVTPAELVRAVFPGGSITGAPKERAIEILASIEPVPRGLYTGCLFWFDDDGSTLSSILIRSALVREGSVSIGAGGGIVADSDPEAEWMEANAKARALTRAVGFEPEEAI